MKIDYTGKTIVVTGAGGGIGRASTLLFARLGGSIVATDIHEENWKRRSSSWRIKTARSNRSSPM